MSLVSALEPDTGCDGDGLVALVARLRVVLATDLALLSLTELRAVSTGLRSVRSWVDASSARVTAAISAVGGAAAGSADVRESNMSGREQRRQRDVAAAVTNAPVFVAALEAGAATGDDQRERGRRVGDRGGATRSVSGLALAHRGELRGNPIEHLLAQLEMHFVECVPRAGVHDEFAVSGDGAHHGRVVRRQDLVAVAVHQ